MTVGLRISLLDPDPAPAKKKITEDKIQVIVEWAQKNQKSIADIEAMYDFESDIVRQAIVDALDDLPA